MRSIRLSLMVYFLFGQAIDLAQECPGQLVAHPGA
jgi:hypothetical protein